LNDEIQESQNNNVFWAFIDDDENYKFADSHIANSSSSSWSWPGWNSSYSASHFDHILISNELFDDFANPLSGCETIIAEEYLQGGWQEYDNYVSDHRPVGILLTIGN